MDDFERKAPRSAIALYIKMYSKENKQHKKGTSLITEAAKSWLSLTEAEKNEFANKYKECKLLLRQKVSNQLKNIQPYMKKKRKTNLKKVPSLFTTDLNSTCNSNITWGQNESKILQENNCNLNLLENLEQSRIAGCPEHDFHCKTSNDTMKIPVVHEPNPPALLSGQQLFNMIQKDDTKSWAQLLPAQRRQYQTAVLSIKKNYIKEYKSYLESLSTVNLLEHYKNVKNELV